MSKKKELINKGFAKLNYKIIDSANLLCNNKNHKGVMKYEKG